MFNWVRRLINNRNRAIFSFWDGKRVRKIDPLLVYRALNNHPVFDWESHPQMIDQGGEAESLEATAITASAVRSAFGVDEYSGKGGLTESECIGLLVQFVDYLTALKKNGSTSPTSQGLMASDLQGSRTRPNSVSTSTSTESKFEEANPS